MNSILSIIAALMLLSTLTFTPTYTSNPETELTFGAKAYPGPITLLSLIKRDVTPAPRYFPNNSTELHRFKRQSGCCCCCFLLCCCCCMRCC